MENGIRKLIKWAIYSLSLGTRLVLPAAIFLAGILRMEKDRLERIYVRINNIAARYQLQRKPPERLLLLLPHCMQNKNCNKRITEDINNCRRCGGCKIGEAADLAENMGISAVVKLTVWINKDYCKNGYVYMTPFDEHRASIVVITTDVNEKEIDRYWELFLYGESIKNPIVEEFTLCHKSGFVYPHQLGNTFFIGNAGGGVEPFLGFGHLNASIMAVAAARTIALGWSFEKQVKGIFKRNDEMRRFRMMFNKMTNNQYDYLIWSLGLPGLKQLIYSTNINVSKYGALASRLLLKKAHR